MPKFLEDLAEVLPGFPVLWTEFCYHEGESSRPWEAKLNDDVRCLDRDWRKLVFKLLDYMRMALGLPNHHYYGDKRRLETIVYPFRYHYARSFSDFDAPRMSPSPIFTSTTYSEWPWPPKDIAEALSDEPRINKELKMAFDDIEGGFRSACNGTVAYNESFWRCYLACLQKADEHDMGRLVFGSMNSGARHDILAISDGKMKDIMGTVQTLVDHRVTNYHALRNILFELVKKKGFLPSTMRLTEKVLWEASSGEPRAGGGMADIFLGRYRGKRVALKKMRLMKNREALRAAQRQEAIIWRQLKHDNIMPLIGICDNLIAGCDLLVSSWMDDGDLPTYIKSTEAKGGLIDGKDFMRQIASGLQYLHDQDPQIIHCDLRAANVLVNEDYRGPRLLLIDFGVAKIEQIQTIFVTSDGTQGSLRWMAPELLKPPDENRGPVLSTRTDVYAFAMTCLEIFSGTFPFPNDRIEAAVLLKVIMGTRPERPITEAAERRGLDDAVWSLITSCWSHEQAKRPSVAHVLSHLDAISKNLIPFTASPVLLDSPHDFDEPFDDFDEERNGRRRLSLTHTPMEDAPPVPPSPQMRWLSGIFHNLAQNFTAYRSHLPSVSGASDATTVPTSRGPPTEISDTSELLISPGIKRRRSLSPPVPRKALTYSEVARSRAGAISDVNNVLARGYGQRRTVT